MGTQAFESGPSFVLKGWWDAICTRRCPDLDLGGLQLEVDGSGGAREVFDGDWDVLRFDPDTNRPGRPRVRRCCPTGGGFGDNQPRDRIDCCREPTWRERASLVHAAVGTVMMHAVCGTPLPCQGGVVQDCAALRAWRRLRGRGRPGLGKRRLRRSTGWISSSCWLHPANHTVVKWASRCHGGWFFVSDDILESKTVHDIMRSAQCPCVGLGRGVT